MNENNTPTLVVTEALLASAVQSLPAPSTRGWIAVPTKLGAIIHKNAPEHAKEHLLNQFELKKSKNVSVKGSDGKVYSFPATELSDETTLSTAKPVAGEWKYIGSELAYAVSPEAVKTAQAVLNENSREWLRAELLPDKAIASAEAFIENPTMKPARPYQADLSTKDAHVVGVVAGYEWIKPGAVWEYVKGEGKWTGKVIDSRLVNKREELLKKLNGFGMESDPEQIRTALVGTNTIVAVTPQYKQVLMNRDMKALEMQHSTQYRPENCKVSDVREIPKAWQAENDRKRLGIKEVSTSQEIKNNGWQNLVATEVSEERKQFDEMMKNNNSTQQEQENEYERV